MWLDVHHFILQAFFPGRTTRPCCTSRPKAHINKSMMTIRDTLRCLPTQHTVPQQLQPPLDHQSISISIYLHFFILFPPISRYGETMLILLHCHQTPSLTQLGKGRSVSFSNSWPRDRNVDVAVVLGSTKTFRHGNLSPPTNQGNLRGKWWALPIRMVRRANFGFREFALLFHVAIQVSLFLAHMPTHSIWSFLFPPEKIHRKNPPRRDDTATQSASQNSVSKLWSGSCRSNA